MNVSVRTPRQEEESARVLTGFTGQSLPGRAPRHERGKSGGLPPAGRGVAPTYPGGCGRGGTFSYMAGIRLYGANWPFVLCRFFLIGRSLGTFVSISLPGNGLLIVDVCPWDSSGTFRRGQSA